MLYGRVEQVFGTLSPMYFAHLLFMDSRYQVFGTLATVISVIIIVSDGVEQVFGLLSMPSVVYILLFMSIGVQVYGPLSPLRFGSLVRYLDSCHRYIPRKLRENCVVPSLWTKAIDQVGDSEKAYGQ